jgi:flagellar biosynthesis/type III secretory pathway protein FliH
MTAVAKVIKRIDFDPEFEPVLFSPVIEREVLDGLQKARKMIERARAEAARIRKNARGVLAEAQVEREEERRRGFEEGRQEGLAELTEKIVGAGEAHEKVLREAEPEIVRMVMEIAEKVIGRELKKGAVVDVVKKAVAQAVGQKIAVRVHPSDASVLKEKEAELMEVLDQTQSIVVKEDETVPPGGCLVESELGTVDARLETQLKGIRKALGL